MMPSIAAVEAEPFAAAGGLSSANWFQLKVQRKKIAFNYVSLKEE